MSSILAQHTRSEEISSYYIATYQHQYIRQQGPGRLLPYMLYFQRVYTGQANADHNSSKRTARRLHVDHVDVFERKDNKSHSSVALPDQGSKSTSISEDDEVDRS